jgi:hypothetical protein
VLEAVAGAVAGADCGDVGFASAAGAMLHAARLSSVAAASAVIESGRNIGLLAGAVSVVVGV